MAHSTPSPSDVFAQSLELHRTQQGKLAVQSTVKVTNRQELSLAYTPGVAEPCRVIAKDPAQSYDLTWRGRTVAVVSDGTAVLGLGDIGPEAGLPVMEGKALLMKEFADVDAVPLVINTKDTQEIIRFVQQIVPSFAGINLEDISAPRCFEVEDALQDVGIPVFHDDQHGTAIVVTAALHNAAKVVGKNYTDLKVVVVGAGAAGLATSYLLAGLECRHMSCRRLEGVEAVAQVRLVDSTGIIAAGREKMNEYKTALALATNPDGQTGSLADALTGADVVIGVSGPGLIKPEYIQLMADQAIVFALANPTPEIMPDEAKAAGAAVVATGRSDFPNQINNVLAFPGVFRAVVEGRLKKITVEQRVAAAKCLAAEVAQPTAEQIIPDPFTPELAQRISSAILEQKK